MGWLKKQMWKVLEWKDDSQDTLVYRFDMKDQEIMSGSQLTVRESQVAIFVHLGKIADVFGPGKYKLETRNLPILSGLGALLYQGESRFKAELYFINTKQFIDQKWGTTTPVAMRDKDFGAIRIKAYGTYAFRVTEPKVFLKEVFGTNAWYKVQDIQGRLKNDLVSQLSDTIAESKISALDMASNYQEFAQMVQANAQSKFQTLGLSLTDFTVSNVNFPEAVEKALDERTALGIFEDKMGTYTQKKAADALGDAAKNPGMAGAFVGMNMGQSAGSVVGQSFANINNAQDKPKQNTTGGKFCPECGTKLVAQAKFCVQCGAKQSVKPTCPKCNAEVSPTAKFCAECGEKLN